jgi:hypothetical protein
VGTVTKNIYFNSKRIENIKSFKLRKEFFLLKLIDMLSWEIYEVCLVNFEKLNLGVIFSSNLSTQENKNYLSFNSKEEEGRLEWGMSGNVCLLEVRCWETFKFLKLWGDSNTPTHTPNTHTHQTHTHSKHTHQTHTPNTHTQTHTHAKCYEMENKFWGRQQQWMREKMKYFRGCTCT